MVRSSSIFSQILSFLPRQEFDALVAKHNGDFASKGFSCRDQFVAMSFCHLAQAKSLSEICNGLHGALGKLVHLGLDSAPKKSTLAYANEHRPWELYRDLFYAMLPWCRQFAPSKKFRFKNKLLSLDTTVVMLCLSLFPWANYTRIKGAIKLHLLLDHDGYLPSFALLTEGSVSDVRLAQLLALPKDSILVMDAGYNDYGMFARWIRQGVFFVTRMRTNTAYNVVESRVVPAGRNIISDEIIEFSHDKAWSDCPYQLRRVVVWDDVNERELVLLTNHLHFGASTISAIYKDRWQIELFFKAIKQSLRIKTFVGISVNAVHIQIWTALIAMLVLKVLQFRSRAGWSLSNLVAMLKWNLLTYRGLDEWLADPYSERGIAPVFVQLEFPFGQHP
jgi:hypothetical protein